MAWMETTAERRAHPQRDVARRALGRSCWALNYGPDRDPLAALARRDRGAISVYAQGDDYHELIKKRLKAPGPLAGGAAGAAR